MPKNRLQKTFYDDVCLKINHQIVKGWLCNNTQPRQISIYEDKYTYVKEDINLHKCAKKNTNMQKQIYIRVDTMIVWEITKKEECWW